MVSPTNVPLFSASPDCSSSGSYTIPVAFDTNIGYVIEYYPNTTVGIKGLIQAGYDADMETYITGKKTDINNILYYARNDASFTPGQQAENDTIFLNGIKAEYCFFRVRYQAFLNAFIGAIAGTGNTTVAQRYLDITTKYNKCLNGLIRYVDYIANSRSAYVNSKNDALNILNNSLNASKDELTRNDAVTQLSVLNTRKEMIRYTKEKNNSVTNHISLWAALNVVAIAMIFHLYRKI